MLSLYPLKIHGSIQIARALDNDEKMIHMRIKRFMMDSSNIHESEIERSRFKIYRFIRMARRDSLLAIFL